MTFAKYVATYGGSLTSIDLNIDTAIKVLDEHELLGQAEINLIPDYSVNRLAKILFEMKGEKPYDLILLDSDNDADLILHEYMVARHLLKPGGVILVDDVDMKSTGVVKGHTLIPWLNKYGVPYETRIRTGNGYSTGVLVITP